MRTGEVARGIFAAIHPVIGPKPGICSRTACLYLGGFQADRVDEIIQSLNDGCYAHVREGPTPLDCHKASARKVGCDLKYLPEAFLACAYSGDDEESAEQAYAAIRSWMKVPGYRSAGPKRELYLGPMLEIQFPLPGNS
jgi:hypothetical protein